MESYINYKPVTLVVFVKNDLNRNLGKGGCWSEVLMKWSQLTPSSPLSTGFYGLRFEFFGKFGRTKLMSYMC